MVRVVIHLSKQLRTGMFTAQSLPLERKLEPLVGDTLLCGNEKNLIGVVVARRKQSMSNELLLPHDADLLVTGYATDPCEVHKLCMAGWKLVEGDATELQRLSQF